MSRDRFSGTNCHLAQDSRLPCYRQDCAGRGLTESGPRSKTWYRVLCVPREELLGRVIGNYLVGCNIGSEIHHKTAPNSHKIARWWLVFKLFYIWRANSRYILEAIHGHLERWTNESTERKFTDFETWCSWFWDLHLWSKSALLHYRSAVSSLSS